LGRVAVTITDPADIRACDFSLPDDVASSDLAARVAEVMKFPKTGPDGNEISYLFVAVGGVRLAPGATLAELPAMTRPRFRIVPEIAANSHIDGDQRITDPGITRMGEQRALVHDSGLDLPVDVLMDAAAHREIERLAQISGVVECGGLLVGDIEVEAKKRVVHVRAVIPAAGAPAGSSEIRFNGAAWESMLRVRDERYSEQRVIGWFHTHPGWGVYLSDADAFIHEHFFPHPNMTAYVLDTRTGRDSFFCWQDGRIVPSPSYGLVSPAESVTETSRAETSGVPSRWKPRMRELAVGVVAFAAGAAAMGLLHKCETPKELPTASQVAPKSVSTSAPVSSRELAPKPVPKPKPSVRTYAIGRGENLWIICNRVYNNGDLAPELARYNGLRSFVGLQVGQQIKLPPKDVLLDLAQR